MWQPVHNFDMIIKKVCAIILLMFCTLWGLAQEKYMFVFLNDNPAKEDLSMAEMDSIQGAHLDNIKRMTLENKLLLAGSLEGDGVIFVLNTQSAKEAREWLNKDPAVNAGRYYIEILPWNIRYGKLCQIDEEVQFATYTFIRYNTYITKFNVQQAPLLLRQHDVYLKQIIQTGNVLLEGFFDNSDGGIMIMSGEVEDDVLLQDPSVKNGLVQPDPKKIWVVKGSFCEK